MEIPVGIIGRAEDAVTERTTARTVGSGSLEVYATPCMAALMEKAACEALSEYLDDGDTSVGTELNIKHIMSTYIGGKVRAEAEVTAVSGRKIEFRVAAYDGAGLIGEGTHQRFAVTADRFIEKSRKRSEGVS